jgi:UDP-3-O-[3-hydroxymyristoyl] glucosamine N-acyltransferase
MPDARFFLTRSPIALGDAVQIAGAELSTGGAGGMIARAASPGDATLDDAVVFVDDEEMAARLAGKKVGLCFATPAASTALRETNGAVAITKNARAAYAAVAARLHDTRPLGAGAGASIDISARLHKSAVVGDGAVIGAGCDIGPNAVIGPGVVIGARTTVADGASVWCALVGADCRIGPSCAIGGPGFGFAIGPEGLARVPQLGRVTIEDGVEIGAHVCVDRGALGDTVIGAGTKIDNLVQIGHNVRLGRACVIAAQVGIAGSTMLGDRVQCGGQAGIADHLTIGEDARIAAKAGVMRNVPAGQSWGGYPARLMTTWMRETASLSRVAARKKKAEDDGD